MFPNVHNVYPTIPRIQRSLTILGALGGGPQFHLFSIRNLSPGVASLPQFYLGADLFLTLPKTNTPPFHFSGGEHDFVHMSHGRLSAGLSLASPEPAATWQSQEAPSRWLGFGLQPLVLQGTWGFPPREHLQTNPNHQFGES